MDTIYDRMNDDMEAFSEIDPEERSQICDFYNGQVIFLTGITGFLGKCLLEKLLRTCTGIPKIYTLVRPKRHASVEERLKKYFEEKIFERLRTTNPDFASKVVPIIGDLAEPGLGLSAEDRCSICKDTTLIIHNGSSVNFRLRISKALAVNVLGTQRMLELAEECKNLKGFLYVSTGFSQSHLSYIEERCYPPPADLKMANDIIRADVDNAAGITEEALESLRSPHENNYIFTKATAEGLVEAYSRKAPFPCGMYRPTIVSSTVKEPISNWCNNFNGPVASVLAYAVGLLHVFYIKRGVQFEVVPADFTVNGMLAATWDLITFKKPREKCYVYHYSSSLLNPSTLYRMREIIMPTIIDAPTIRMMWYPCNVYVESYTTFMILHYLFHMLPCVLIDLSRLIRGKSLLAIPTFMKENKSLNERLNFANSSLTLDMKEMPTIWQRMNALDHKYFYCDIRQLDWEEYLSGYWAGLRYYLLKDSPDTIPEARKKYRRLRNIHYTFAGVIVLIVAYFMYNIVGRVFGS